MVDEAIAQGAGDFSLQPLDLLVGEFHHLARLHVDEVVVMLFRPLLIARPAIAEVVPLQDARLLEELHRAVHGGNGDPGIALDGTLIDELAVRMVVRLREHPRDDAGPPVPFTTLFYTQQNGST